MADLTYNVLVDEDLVAEGMRIDTAMILVAALFEKYFEQAAYCGRMTISIQALAKEE